MTTGKKTARKATTQKSAPARSGRKKSASAVRKSTPEKKRAPACTRLKLSGNLDIDEAVKLHARLGKCANKKLDVNINAGDVESADTAGLQLLLAFVNGVTSTGKIIKWQSTSPALEEAASKAGISEQLGLLAA